MKRLKQNKKGVIDQLVQLVISLVVIGVVIAIAFLIMAEVGSNSSVLADNNTSKAINQTRDAMAEIPGWLPIVVITVIGALLISLVALFRNRQ